MSNSRFKAHSSIILANVIFGLNYSIAKYVLNGYVKSMGLNVLRVLGSIVLFWLASIFVKEKLDRKDVKRIALAGLLGIVINQVFFLKGLTYTTPIDSSIIMTATPIMVLLMAGILLHEKIKPRKIAGTIIGCIGAITLILFSGRGSLDFSKHTAIGNGMQLINAAAYACYLIVVKPLMGKYHPVTVLKWAYVFGAIIVLPLGFNEFAQINWQSLPLQAFLSIAYVVVFSSFVAFVLNVYALAHLSPTVVSSYVYSQPAIATGFALMIGIDHLSWVKVLSASLVFLGVYLASIPERQEVITC